MNVVLLLNVLVFLMNRGYCPGGIVLGGFCHMIDIVLGGFWQRVYVVRGDFVREGVMS